MTTNHTITFAAKIYTYTLRKSQRARRLRIVVAPGGVITVSAPKRAQQHVIERFLGDHAEWIRDRVHHFEKIGTHHLTHGGQHEYARHKAAARTLALKRLTYFNQVYGFTYQRISIRNQKTRWGSCSKQGNLSFNYRIALLPPVLADYIILHELCHLGAMDHSTRFWQLVAQSMPDYRQQRQTLRQIERPLLTT